MMKNILVCGRNFHARQLLRRLRSDDRNRILAIVDFTDKCSDKSFMGLPIVHYDELNLISFDEVAITGRYVPEMTERLLSRGVKMGSIKEYGRTDYMLRGEELKTREAATWELIDKFLNFATQYRFKYWFVAGALLGIKRSQNLSWFADVDIAIPEEDIDNLSSRFVSYFGKSSTRTVHRKIYHKDNSSFKKQSISQVILSVPCDITYKEPPILDLHAIRTEGEKALMAVGELDVIQCKKSHFDSYEIENYRGRNLRIPVNPDRYLLEIYGSNWRIPLENFYVSDHLTRNCSE